MPLIQQFLNTKKINASGFWQVGKEKGQAQWEYFGDTPNFIQAENIPVEHWLNRCDGVHRFKEFSINIHQIFPGIVVFDDCQESSSHAIVFLAWEQRKFEKYKLSCQYSLRNFTKNMSSLIVKNKESLSSEFITKFVNELDTLRIQQNFYTPVYCCIQSSDLGLENFPEIQHVFPIWSEQSLRNMFKQSSVSACITGRDELIVEYKTAPNESLLSKFDCIPEISYELSPFTITIQIVPPPFSTNTLTITSGKTVRLDVKSNEIYMICSKILKKLHIDESVNDFADVVVIDRIPHVLRHNTKYICIGDLDLKSYTPVAKIIWPVSSDDFKETLCLALKKETSMSSSMESKLVFSENPEIIHMLKQIGASVTSSKETATYFIGEYDTSSNSLDTRTLQYPFKLQSILEFLNGTD